LGFNLAFKGLKQLEPGFDLFKDSSILV